MELLWSLELGAFNLELSPGSPILVLQRMKLMNRRHFLAAGTVGTVGFAAGCATTPDPRPRIIDTHTHFYDPTRPAGVPWPPEDDPVLYRPVLPAEFVALTAPLGVVGTVVVEASPWVEDNQWLLDLAAEHPVILGVVGNLKPGTPEFRTHLKRFARNPKFKGIRVDNERLQAALHPGTVQEDLRFLADLRLTLDLLIPPQELPAAAALGNAVRDLRIIVDHCANVPVGSPPPPDWTAGLAACHYAPNVFMKISGLVEGTGRRGGLASTDPAAYQAVLESVWHPFGAERLLFGSNWPVSLHFAEYPTVLQIVTTYLTAHGKAATHQVLLGNAIQIYRLRHPSR